MEKFAVAAGIAIRYNDSLKGDKTVVLLHGYLENLDVWEEWSKMLAKHCRVISLDLPGHGISEVKGEIHTMEFLAETAHGLLESLGVERYAVIGHSMGGYVAMEMMKKWPSAISGAIFLHSHPFGDTPQRAEDRMREIELIRSGRKEVLVKMNPQRRFAAENCKRLASVIDELKEMAFLTEDEGILAILRGISQRGNYVEMMSKTEIPTLFVFGSGDLMIPQEACEEVAKQFPAAQVVVLDSCGHMSFIEQPEKTLEIVTQFCDKLNF